MRGYNSIVRVGGRFGSCFTFLAVTMFILSAATSASADAVTFEWTEGQNSQFESRHGVGGPVLADDFIPLISGKVVGIEWWGTRAGSARWEVTFHHNAAGVPAATMPSGGIAQHFVNAVGADPDNDGIFHYAAIWNPEDLILFAGTNYWFSVANDASGWHWATPVGALPTVGSQAFSGVVSTGVGPNGGPHFGPWNRVGENFAFRIIVPEPVSLALLGVGFGALLLGRRRRTEG